MRPSSLSPSISTLTLTLTLRGSGGLLDDLLGHREAHQIGWYLGVTIRLIGRGSSSSSSRRRREEGGGGGRRRRRRKVRVGVRVGVPIGFHDPYYYYYYYQAPPTFTGKMLLSAICQPIDSQIEKRGGGRRGGGGKRS